MLKKLARFYPFLVVLAIFGALAIFIAAAPNKPAIFGGNNTDPLPLSSQTEPDTIEAIPRKTPTIPVVESTSITNTKVQVVDLMYGQQVRVNDGALYFETADFSGSGKQGTVGNRYTEALYISGFAAVDPSTGRLVEAEAYTRDEVPTGKKAPAFIAECQLETIWIALCTDGYEVGDVGWVSIFEINWQDKALTISPEAEDHLNTFEDLVTYLSHPILCISYILDDGYAIDREKAFDFGFNYNFWERHIWSGGGFVLMLGGERVCHPQYQYIPISDNEAVKNINSWIDKERDGCLRDSESDAYVWADYDPYIDVLYNGILSQPFYGKNDILVIVTNTHERDFEELKPCDAFEKVIILDISPEYSVNSTFKAKVEAAYGPVSDITEQDIYDYSLAECLEAFS